MTSQNPENNVSVGQCKEQCVDCSVGEEFESSLSATVEELNHADSCAVLVRGVVIDHSERKHPDMEGYLHVTMKVQSDDWIWELDRIDNDWDRIRSECQTIVEAGGVLASGAFYGSSKGDLECIVMKWEPWVPSAKRREQVLDGRATTVVVETAYWHRGRREDVMARLVVVGDMVEQLKAMVKSDEEVSVVREGLGDA